MSALAIGGGVAFGASIGALAGMMVNNHPQQPDVVFHGSGRKVAEAPKPQLTGLEIGAGVAAACVGAAIGGLAKSPGLAAFAASLLGVGVTAWGATN